MLQLIEQKWAWLSLVFAAAILAFLPPGWATDRGALLWLLAASLLLHQFEEFVFPGGFREFYNQSIRPGNRLTHRSLTPAGILLVNVVVAWPAYFLAALTGGGVSWIATGMALVTLLNGLLHTAFLVARKSYNPGTVTALFLLIPVSAVLLKYAVPAATPGDGLAAIAFFLAGSATVPAIIHLTGKKA
jgi:hypothetical protein